MAAKAIYDYVIVGAGAAGCVLANRLTRDPKVKVLVLEAGSKDWYPWIHIPAGYLYTMNNPRTDWCFKTTSQPGLNGRALNYPRGKVVGGCTSINGMIYQRGQPQDYEKWAEKNPGWGWDSVLPLFNRSLDYSFGADETHHAGGEWRVEGQRAHYEILDEFINAASEIGLPQKNHFNNSATESVGYFQVNQRNGMRVSAYRAFLHPVLSRENLTLISSAMSKNIEFKDDVATGITYTDSAGKSHFAGADKEVILSAGAVNSPHLLQVSGVGASELLEKNGVAVRHNLPGVGQNLQDHLQIRAIFKVQDTVTLNRLAGTLAGRMKIGLEYLTSRRGPLASAPSQLGAFCKSSDAVETPDLEFHVQPLSLDKFGDPLHEFDGLTLSVCNLRPTSRGSVTLSGPSVDTEPLIDPQYLSTENDRFVAAQSIRWARKSMEAPSMQKFSPEEYLPGTDLQSDEDLARVCGDISTTIFHPTSTCKMGPATDAGAVVDHRLRVHGIKRLRVADASIMPDIVSGNTSSPSVMIGERMADILAEDHSHTQ